MFDLILSNLGLNQIFNYLILDNSSLEYIICKVKLCMVRLLTELLRFKIKYSDI
jgi:hypothetical protein